MTTYPNFTSSIPAGIYTWQPIDYAPKDGREIFLYIPGDTFNKWYGLSRFMVIGRWRQTGESLLVERRDADTGRALGVREEVVQPEDEGWEITWGGDPNDTNPIKPTAWCSLPCFPDGTPYND